MNSLKKGDWVPLLNFEGVPGPRSQCPEIPEPGVLVPLLHHALYFQINFAITKICFETRLAEDRIRMGGIFIVLTIP